MMGTSPQTPGWNISLSGQNGWRGRQAAPPFRPRERRSGSIPGEPYPPSRLRQYNAGAARGTNFFIAGDASGALLIE